MHLRKPSPATVVALFALFFALGGTAVAAKHYLITSTRQIEPSVLRQLHGSNGARGSTGPQGLQGPQGSGGAQGPAGAPGAPATGLWAAITTSDTLAASSGVTGISGGSGGNPVTVTFDRAVNDCAHIATISTAGDLEGGPDKGEIAITRGLELNPDSIAVYTYNSAGGQEYLPFSVAVFC